MRGRPETPDSAVGRGAARGVRRAPASEPANACICYSYYPRKAGQSLHLVPERVKRGIALPKALDPAKNRKFQAFNLPLKIHGSKALRDTTILVQEPAAKPLAAVSGVEGGSPSDAAKSTRSETETVSERAVLPCSL